MEKPFIKLFHTPNSGYFYDVGKNEIIRIPENVYLHLLEVMDGAAVLDQSDDVDVLEMIESFKELGYLSSKRPKRIYHSATTAVPLLLDRCISKITLQLTQDCNFRCKYCIYSEDKNHKQRSHANKSMSLETAKKAIVFYREHAVDANMYNVGFYGGEPLLQWDLLKEAVFFAEKELTGKLLTLSITTNASLLTETRAAFLDEHNISTTVSIDGIKAVNDNNRVFKDGSGTSDVVFRNLRMIKEKYPNLFRNLLISSVIGDNINPTTFGFYPEVLTGLPLSNFFVEVEDNTEHDTVLPDELYAKMNNEVILAYLAESGLYSRQLNPFGFKQVNRLLSHSSELKSTDSVHEVMAPSGPCIPGKSRLMVAVNGDLFPCERVNEVEANCIGNLEQGFDVEKAQKILNIGIVSESDCRNCWALGLCTACIGQFDYSKENAESEKKRLCGSIIASASERIRGKILLYELQRYYKERDVRGVSI